MAGTVGYSTLPPVFDSDTGLSGAMARISIGSTQGFTIRSAVASGLTTGYSTNSADFVSPPWAKGLQLYVDVPTVVSATSGNFTLGVEVQAKDPVFGNYVSLSSGGWFVASSSNAAGYNGTTGTLALHIYPGIANSTGRSISGIVPSQWRVQSTLAGSSASLTWTISGQYEP